MPSVTNYLKSFKSMRSFIRSLASGIHSRHTASKRGLKKSHHDDILKRLSYFNLFNKIQNTSIGLRHIHTIDKQDFYWGHNYLVNLYSLYAMKPENIIIIMSILDTIHAHPNCTTSDIYSIINDNTLQLTAYQDFIKNKYKKKTSIPSIIEKQMIQRLIKRLVAIGVISEKNTSNKLTYHITSIDLDTYTASDLELLSRAIFFYKNIALFSVSGHTLLEKIESLLTDASLLDLIEKPKEPQYHSQYVFTYNNPIHIIDELLLHKISYAIVHHYYLDIKFFNTRRPNITVKPIRIESDYLGNRDYLIAYQKETRVTLRLDSITSIVIKHSFLNVPQEIMTDNECKTILQIRFFKHQEYEDKWNEFLATFHQVCITIQNDSSTYIDLKMMVQDGQILVPILRTFLPYLQILESTPESIKTRFEDNILHTQGTIVRELPSYTKKPHYSWKLPSPSTLESDNEIVSPLLHEISAITFTTQYRIQQDLIRGIPYTLENIQYITENRPLLNPLSPVEENDQHEQKLPIHLVTSEQNYVLPRFCNLPPILITHTERQFLKDLLLDTRVNWMLPHKLKDSLLNNLKTIDPSIPDNAWRNISLCIHNEPTSYEHHQLCTQALADNKQLICKTIDSEGIISPCKIEYNVATNTYALIAYSLDTENFHYYPMHTILSIKVLKTSINTDINTLYNEYQISHRQSISFSIYDINNAIDRSLQAFCNYEIFGTQTSDIVYTFTVHYLPFQEKDILRILLSLGAAVRVQGDHPIKDKLANIYTQAISLLPTLKVGRDV